VSLADDLRRVVQGKVLEGAPLHQRTAIRLGGPAEILFQPASAIDLVAAIKVARQAGVPYRTLGGGSNTLVGDKGVRGLIIHLGREFATEEDAGPNEVLLGAALPGIRALQAARRRGRTGPEFLAGIPGTLGGHAAMNAGTREGEIGSLLLALEVARPEGLAWIDSEALELGYRSCKLPPGSVVTRLRLKLLEGDLAEADRRMEADLRYRRDTQPLNQPNLGSTFRNPPGDKAGRLLEAVGLKGERQGDVGFSERHANFLVNFGAGKSSDALALIDRARLRVQESFGIELRLEIALLGEF
jgi:UDP-N-acetylmuramate dehydrogenase